MAKSKGRGGAKKRSRRKSVLPPAPIAALPNGDVDVVVGDDGSAEVSAGGAIITSNADGSVDIEFNPPPAATSTKFDDNLALHLSDFDLGRIASSLIDAIDEDIQDREDWLQQRADGMDLLALKVEKPGSGNAGTSATSVPGQSTVRDPIMLEAVLRFQANAFAELCPSGGPCKTVNYGDGSTTADKLAEDLEKDINSYLTATAKEYIPDTRRMLFWTGYASGMFKKIYSCPLRRRPVSESVDGADLIVPSNVTDLHNAGRVTHQISMRQAVMKRMQILGVYRKVPLAQPKATTDALKAKEQSLAGVNPSQQRAEDEPYTIYECYCELDLTGFEHHEKGAKEPSGLPLPYRVTIERDSREILEIRRNWREQDEDYTARIPFVAFPYATGIGIYGSGLLHILGNTTMALTAMLREAIDAGMYANFPGALIAAPATRQKNNQLRVAPGSVAPIDIPANMRIGDAIMPLPYKDVTPGLFNLMGMMRDVGNRVGGSAEVPVGEGVQNAPVGTTLAMIEQATKVESGVHKALHAAQAEELQQLMELFKDNPEALWMRNRRSALGKTPEERLTRFKQAVEQCDIQPASDPNVSSHMQRMAKAQALKQLTMGNPSYDQIAVDRHIAAMLRIDDFDRFIAPPQINQGPVIDPAIAARLQIDKQNADTAQMKVALGAEHDKAALASKENVETLKIAAAHDRAQQSATQGPDPMREAELVLKGRNADFQEMKLAADHQRDAANRTSKETVEAMKIAQAVAVHPLSDPIVDEQLRQMGQYMSPAQSGRMADGGSVKPGNGPTEMAALLSHPDPRVRLQMSVLQELLDEVGDGAVPSVAVRDEPHDPIESALALASAIMNGRNGNLAAGYGR